MMLASRIAGRHKSRSLAAQIKVPQESWQDAVVEEMEEPSHLEAHKQITSVYAEVPCASFRA